MKYQNKWPDISKSVNIHPKVFLEVSKHDSLVVSNVYELAIKDASDTNNNSALILRSIENNAVSAHQFPS